jgi:hypothetical protein
MLFHSSKIWMPGFAHRAFVAHNLLGHLQDPFVLVLKPIGQLTQSPVLCNAFEVTLAGSSSRANPNGDAFECELKMS